MIPITKGQFAVFHNSAASQGRPEIAVFALPHFFVFQPVLGRAPTFLASDRIVFALDLIMIPACFFGAELRKEF